MAKADLHVHSRYSDRPSEWLMRRLGAPECFSDPREVYDKARAQGMSFVTISDHDSIGGALEIAHLPGAFVSCEVTASFPEDGCKLHLLVFGISEAQFGEIDRLRGNVYELRDYLAVPAHARALRAAGAAGGDPVDPRSGRPGRPRRGASARLPGDRYLPPTSRPTCSR